MGRPDHSQGEMAPSSRRARLIRNFRYVCNVGRFDAHFLKKRRSAGEPSAERFDKAIITFCAFGAGCRARLLRECRRRRQPEADEQGYGLKRNSVVALKPLEYSHDAVEPLGDRGLPPIGIVRRKKRPNRGLGNQRLGLALTCGIGLQAGEYPWIDRFKLAACTASVSPSSGAASNSLSAGGALRMTSSCCGNSGSRRMPPF